MKKLVNLVLFIFILLLFYLTESSNMLIFTVSFGMFMLFSGLFSTTSLKRIINNKKYYIVRDKLFKYSLLSILLIGVFLSVIAYYVGGMLNADKICVFMTLFLVSNVLLKIIEEYLEVIGYKKIGNNLVYAYYIVVLLIDSILLIFKVNNYVFLYLVGVVVFLLTLIILYWFIFRKLNKSSDEKKKVNYIAAVKGILVNDKNLTIFNIVNGAYVYISIIILYYVLANKYNYSYEAISTIISNTYFYGLIVIFFIYNIIKKNLNISLDNVKDSFNISVNKIIKVFMNICILLIVISGPVSYLLFDADYNVLLALIPLIFVYGMYDYVMKLNVIYCKKSLLLMVGLIIKVIFELPLINTVYRMGYSLAVGSVLSIIMGLIVSIVIGIIFIKIRFRLNLLDNFNSILNIVYDSIIYCLILVLFTMIVKVDTTNLLSSILTIIFYIFITVLFYVVKIKLKH